MVFSGGSNNFFVEAIFSGGCGGTGRDNQIIIFRLFCWIFH